MIATATKRYDVLILGTGMSGTILGAILARHGISVGMIDSKSHPRFAIGESTIPHTSLLLSLLSEQYGILELDRLAYPDRIARHICTTCGIKRSFGFAYHREGLEYDHRNGHQFGTSSKDENHLFRQDIDMHLLEVAKRYGAAAYLSERVTDLVIDASGVTVETDAPRKLMARYVVDGTGYRSYVADKYSLREDPCPLKHHSRTLFTHMEEVGLFKDGESPLALPWSQCTLHHVFDGGWFWVIPFNNSPFSTNPLVSVGLTVDSSRFPYRQISPEEEFSWFLGQFPSVQRQFNGAKPVRPWTGTGRLQYSSRRSTGYRYCLMSHSSGFVDPLFSRGMINTLEIVAALVEPLLRALEDDDFSPERFRRIDELQTKLLSYNDTLVHYAFKSWADFDLWNAWVRVWALGTIVTEFRMINVLAEYTATHDAGRLKGEASDPVFSEMEDPDYAAFFSRACSVMRTFLRDELSAVESAGKILDIAKEYRFPVPLTVEGMRRAGWLRSDEDLSERNLEVARQGYRWAIGNPNSRDLFGTTETFYRWRSKMDDAHLLI